MSKKFLSFCLVVLLIFTLVACLNIKDDKDKTTNGNISNESETNDTSKETNTDIDVDKVTDEDEIKNTTSSDNSTKETCRLFFFDTQELKQYYIDKELTIIDKAKVNALTKELQENETNPNFLRLTNKVGVSSAKLDGDILKIYFNEDFTKLMTLGSSTESGLIQSLVNTYGYNYKVNKIAIYVNKELYTGLKGELEDGYYTVDTTGIEEYK